MPNFQRSTSTVKNGYNPYSIPLFLGIKGGDPGDNDPFWINLEMQYLLDLPNGLTLRTEVFEEK